MSLGDLLFSCISVLMNLPLVDCISLNLFVVIYRFKRGEEEDQQ